MYRLFCSLAILVAVLVLGTVLHEGGHGITAMAWGADLQQVAVMPGLQLFPSVEFIAWDGWVARVSHTSLPHPTARGWVVCMGSGTSALAALVLLGLWALYQRGATLHQRPSLPPSIAWATALAILIWSTDSVAYTFAPLLGLRHWIVVGGRAAETTQGAQILGWELSWFYTGVILYGAAMYTGLGFLCTRWAKRRAPHKRKPPSVQQTLGL